MLVETGGAMLLVVLVDMGTVLVNAVFVVLKAVSDPGIVSLPTTRDCRINRGE